MTRYRLKNKGILETKVRKLYNSRTCPIVYISRNSLFLFLYLSLPSLPFSLSISPSLPLCLCAFLPLGGVRVKKENSLNIVHLMRQKLILSSLFSKLFAGDSSLCPPKTVYIAPILRMDNNDNNNTIMYK